MTTSCPNVPSKLSIRSWLAAPRLYSPLPPAEDCRFAEIKPHNEKGIRDGLNQLAKEKGLGRAPRKGKFLVTYLPLKGKTPAPSGFPTSVRVFATPYSAGMKATSPPYKNVADTITSWEWHDLGSFAPEKQVDVLVEKASLFGSAIEDQVRKLFQDVVLVKSWGKKTGYGGGGNLQGADIWWTELARFYDELARELGDPFYADLASELASLGREAARWDAA